LADDKKMIFDSIIEGVRTEGKSLSDNEINEIGKYPFGEQLRRFGVKNLGLMKKTIVDLFIKNIDKIKPVEGLNELRKIKQKKIIFTNNDKKFVKEVLSNWEIKFIKEIYDGSYAGGKIEGLKKLAKEYEVKINEIIYVGDLAKDSDIAKEVGCVGVVVASKASWDSKKDILKVKPSFVINNVGELKDIIEKLDSS